MRGIRIFFAFAVLLSATTLFAAERRVLYLDDIYFRQSGTIDISRQISEHHGDINVRDYILQQVRLTAKTIQGRGHAYLQIGNYNSPKQTVRGNPQDFNDPNERTFDNVEFVPETVQDAQPWLMQFEGTFIARRISVVIERRDEQPDCRYTLYWPHFYWGTQNIYSTIEGAVWNQYEGQPAVCGNRDVTSCVAYGYVYWRGRYLGDGRGRHEICRKRLH